MRIFLLVFCSKTLQRRSQVLVVTSPRHLDIIPDIILIVAAAQGALVGTHNSAELLKSHMYTCKLPLSLNNLRKRERTACWRFWEVVKTADKPFSIKIWMKGRIQEPIKCAEVTESLSSKAELYTANHALVFWICSDSLDCTHLFWA